MQVNNKDFDKLYNAILYMHWCARNCYSKESDAFMQVVSLMEEQVEKERNRWERQYAHIKEKRKEHPNYGRPKSEWKKH